MTGWRESEGGEERAGKKGEREREKREGREVGARRVKKEKMCTGNVPGWICIHLHLF